MGLLADVVGFDLESFASNFKGGARAYLFVWIPTLVELGASTRYMCKSTSMPESTVEELTTYWQGAQYKVAGARRFSDWTLTVHCDPGASIRNAFELWMHEAHAMMPYGQQYGVPVNIDKLITEGRLGYLRHQGLAMLDGEGSPTTGVVLFNSWPKTVGQIALDYGTQEVASFEVTLSYMYHLVVPLSLGGLPIPVF